MGCILSRATTRIPGRVKLDIAKIERMLDANGKNSVASVLIYDDNFSVNSEHTSRVIYLLQEREMPFLFECMVDNIKQRVEELDSKGLFGICVSVESLGQSDIDSSRKKETNRELLSCIKKLNTNEIWFMTTYMLGWERDKPESIKRDLERIESLNIQYLPAMIITLFPGTLTAKNGRIVSRIGNGRIMTITILFSNTIISRPKTLLVRLLGVMRCSIHGLPFQPGYLGKEVRSQSRRLGVRGKSFELFRTPGRNDTFGCCTGFLKVSLRFHG